jgi:hypothetical protein
LTGIRKMAIVDSSYVIFDNYNSLIVRYDAKGKFLNRIAIKAGHLRISKDRRICRR